MQIKFFCPSWGMVPDYVTEIDGDIESMLKRIKSAGYDGVEMAVPTNEKQKDQLKLLLNELELDIIALQYAATGNTIHEYLAAYEVQIKNAASIKPLFINSHTAADYFPVEEINLSLEKALELSKKLDVKIVHETHRGRFSFHSASIQKYLTQYPEIRLTADFSHWCNVSESFLQNQQENVKNAIQKSDHIHSRVGHPQGCQVNDPRAPEWQQALNYHLEWWDEIIAAHREKGSSTFTITAEFGPGNYMPLMPYTLQPLGNQWEINLWITALLKKRYSQ
jgi:sugar phosphate isomerase/epimerase